MKPMNQLIWSTLLTCPLSFSLLAVEPVLDAYAYQLDGTVNIDIENQIISFDSNMTNCLQSNGQDPVETLGLTLFTNQQSFGLSLFWYDTVADRIYLVSETSNVICDNGVYVDTLFEDGFE